MTTTPERKEAEAVLVMADKLMENPGLEREEALLQAIEFALFRRGDCPRKGTQEWSRPELIEWFGLPEGERP